jgi:PAS domain S-box-containing protein
MSDTQYKTKQVLASFYRISRLTMTDDGREDLIQTTLEIIISGLNYDRGALYLLKKGTPILEGVINVGCQVSIKGLKYDLYADECIETRVVKTGEIILVREGCDHHFYTALDRKRNEVLKRTCCVLLPIRTKQGVVGTLLADRSRPEAEIDHDDIEILEIFCHQIGTVIENKWLLESNRQKISDLTLLQRINRRLGDVRQLAGLYEMIVSEALQLARCQASWLLLDEGKTVMPGPVAVCGLAAAEIAKLEVPEQNDRSRSLGQPYYRKVNCRLPDGYTVVGILALPLETGTQVCGVLKLAYMENTDLLGVNVDVLKIFAAQAARAMENLIYHEHLLAERDFRDSILRSTPNAILTVNKREEITTCNQRARQLFSFHGELVGKPVQLVFADPDFTPAFAAIRDRRRDMVQLEFSPRTPQLREREFSVSITALHEDCSRETEYLVIIQDVTHKKRLDREVERMRRLAAIGQLAAGIAHEIRNPLTGINLSLDIIKDALHGHERGCQLLEGAVNELDRLESIVSSLLEFSRPGLMELGTVAVTPMLERCVTLFQEQCRQRGVNLRLEIDDDLSPVRGDAERLRQVLVNLLLNALDAVGGGGTVVIRAFPRWFSPEDAGWPIVDDTCFCGISVSDDGVGMTAEVRERIFDPFFTTRNQGTGLGLSIVHNIIKDHQGWLEVESAPGEGSTFTFYVPTAIADPERVSREDDKSYTYS